MTSNLFIFFAGIALSLGLIEVWLGISKKRFSTDFIFGIFTLAAGSYYLSIGLEMPFTKLSLSLAVLVFALFPWYYALELGFVRKGLLWTITGLCAGYFGAVAFGLNNLHPYAPYVFSYSAYALTAIYCFMGLAHVKEGSRHIFYPFLLVTLYYTIFVMEEMAFNYYGTQLPWRRQLSFTYLDLFPMIIVVNKYVLLIRDQWAKGSLERSLKQYKDNLNLVLDKSDQLVAALTPEGKVIYANGAFKELLHLKNPIKGPFEDLLKGPDRLDFKRNVLESTEQKGSLVTTHPTGAGNLTVTWSFMKQTPREATDSEASIFLFGSDVTRLKRTEQNLRDAFEELETLKNKLQAENIQLRKTLVTAPDEKLIGKSPLFHYVLNRIEEAAPLDIPILLEGETGVGKELFANAIHEKSPRRHKAFIKVNCAAIPAELLESELFGYRKGAFTGAEKDKKGMFEIADGGTLFLDEIGELPLSLQPKLLRAIQDQAIQPLGAEKTRQIDIRLIAATNRNLLDEVKNGNFRSDLYYRLHVFPITVPPLRKRKEDIPPLVEWFINLFNVKYGKNIGEVSESLMGDLRDYPWPGNVRQLRNVLERAVITSSESVLKLAAPLPAQEPDQYSFPSEIGSPASNGHFEMLTLKELERQYISQVLERCAWKISGKSSASEALDLPPSTLRSKMKKLGIRQDAP